MTVVGRRSGWRGYPTPGERGEQEKEGEGRDGDGQDCGLWKYELIFLSSSLPLASLVE